MKNVLVIPSGTEIALEIHEALVRRRDIRLFGAESTDNSHAAFVFACNVRIPECQEKDFLDAANRFVARYEIDFIFPAHDDVQLALLAAGTQLKCEIVSSPLDTVSVTRFKSRTYDLLRDLVPVPERLDANRLRASDFPVFAKPDRGQGSQNTRICNSKIQLDAAMQDGSEMLVWEYLPGREVTVDCFSDRERGLLYVDCRLRKRIRAGISVRSEPFEVEQAREMAIAFTSRLRFFGSWFFQIKERTPGEWVLLEIGARIPGGATYQRLRGVNLPLLSLFEQQRLPVDICVQPFHVVMDRAFVSHFNMDIAFSALYVDFDDTLCLGGDPNPELIALMVLARHQGKKVVLLSRNAGGCHDWLERCGIAAIIDRIVLIDRDTPKSRHIEPGAMLVDDSFAERKACQAAGIICFDVDAVPILIQQLQRALCHERTK